MKLLLDTNIVLWAAMRPERLPSAARASIDDPNAELVFSVVSIWEVAIKAALSRGDFVVDPAVLRRSLLDDDYTELDVTGAHALALVRLPLLHRDPFDRMLLAQSLAEGFTLLTADPAFARYAAPVIIV